MTAHFKNLLESAAAGPSRRISELPFLSADEQQEILFEWNVTGREYPASVCAHQLFEAQAIRGPDAVAVISKYDHLSYGMLNERANRLASWLRTMGVQTDDSVGIFLPRSADLAAAVLAVMKAGGACLPLDPSYPEERLAFMLADSGAALVLSDASLSDRAPRCEARVVCLEEIQPRADQLDGANIVATASPEQSAYVIFTSGSTGRPKGVAMPHRALVNLAHWQKAVSSSAPRTLQFASLNFDVSFQEMVATWHAGGTVLMVDETSRVDPAALGLFIQEHAVERFHLPVVMLQKLAGQFQTRPEAFRSLKELMVGGEQLQITRQMISLFAELNDCTLDNHYGPSESHVVTSFRLPAGSADWPSLPPLGRPISNTRIHILDKYPRPVPIGARGELYIGGECLARGYLRRPETTAERFIPDPFCATPGTRLYKTGDVGRYLPGGNIEFIGRNDFQVKLRGMRIELGEIEAVLRRRPGVKEAVVVVRELKREAGNEKTLIAYVVGSDGGPVIRELRDHLRERLPDYMLPASFIVMKALPLTGSGKVDRLSLPLPDDDLADDESYDAPANAVETVIAGIWEEVLERKRVGAGDNFFHIGGHSLIATQVISRVRETLRVDVPLRTLFEEPTVRGFARAVLEAAGSNNKVERAAQILLKLKDLSEEEAQAMLQSKPGRSTGRRVSG